MFTASSSSESNRNTLFAPSLTSTVTPGTSSLLQRTSSDPLVTESSKARQPLFSPVTSSFQLSGEYAVAGSSNPFQSLNSPLASSHQPGINEGTKPFRQHSFPSMDNYAARDAVVGETPKKKQPLFSPLTDGFHYSPAMSLSQGITLSQSQTKDKPRVLADASNAIQTQESSIVPMFRSRPHTNSQHLSSASYFSNMRQRAGNQRDIQTVLNREGREINAPGTFHNEEHQTLPGFLSAACNPRIGQKRSINMAEERRDSSSLLGNNRDTATEDESQPESESRKKNKTNDTSFFLPSIPPVPRAPTSCAPLIPVQSMWDQRNITPRDPTSTTSSAMHSDATAAGKDNNHTSVTVFGFPADKVSDIVQHFSRFGEIVEHTMPVGNWMTIRFKSAMAAQHALRCNGDVFFDDVMVGVKLASNTNVRTGAQLMRVVPFSESSDLFRKPEQEDPKLSEGPNKTLATSTTTISSNNIQRPQVVVNQPSVNQTATAPGLMSRMREVIFGW